MHKVTALAGAAIALFFAASLALVATLTAPSPPLEPAAVAATAAPAGQEVPAPAVVAAEVAAEGLVTAPIAERPVARPTPPPRASSAPVIRPPASVPTPKPLVRPAWLKGSTQALAPRRDPTPLGPLRPYVAAGMSKLQVAVAGCATEQPPPDALPRARAGQTTLTLHFEALDNKLRIADAVPAGADVADDWRVQCAQRKLRGQEIYAPSKAGPRFEIPFVMAL